jgi:hypothetical protein
MRLTRWLIGLVVVVLLVALYFVIVLSWSYSSGERAGWVQKLSKKGWVCKTWEGELALVSLPGSPLEKFPFTVSDDAVAEQLNQAMGKRVALHYEQKVGLPTSCFGETRYYVTGLRIQEEIPLAAGVVIPGQPGASAPQAASQPAPPVAPPSAP